MAGRTNQSIRWTGKTWEISLSVDGKALQFNWDPPCTFVWRVKRVGEEKWSFGAATPIPHIQIIDLEENAEYEIHIVAVSESAGESEPVILKIRAGSDGLAQDIGIDYPPGVERPLHEIVQQAANASGLIGNTDEE